MYPVNPSDEDFRKLLYKEAMQLNHNLGRLTSEVRVLNETLRQIVVELKRMR